MLAKLILWLILLILEFFFYPSIFNSIEKISGGHYSYEGNPFMNWNLIFHNGSEPLQMFLSFNVILIIIVILWILKDTGINGTTQKATNDTAYGSARWMNISELQSIYPTYSIPSDQKERKGPFIIWKNLHWSLREK